jgi:hypothetical protein
MARYTGPKTRIARKFGEAISEMTKHSKEEVTHLDNTGWLKKRKNLNMLSS